MNIPVRRTSATVPVAPLLDRFWAHVLDAATVFFIALLLSGVLALFSAMSDIGTWDWFSRYAGPGQLILHGLYDIALLSAWGTTLGKQKAGLMVANRRTGERLSPLQAVVRSIVLFGAGVLPVNDMLIFLVVFLPLLWDGVGLYDRIAGTVVTWAPAESTGS